MIRQSNGDGPDATLHPQVIAMEPRRESDVPAVEPMAPRIIATAQTGRMVPAPPVERPIVNLPARRQPNLIRRLAWTGLFAAVSGWFVIDLYLWITSAFDHGTVLGWVASAAAATGIVAAGVIIAREMRSYLALKEVETNQRRLAPPWDNLRPADIQEAIREVIAEIPRDRDEDKAAIEAFQRQVRPHHTPVQQIELLSQTVMTPLDRRAEAIVRRASARTFGITTISPTAVTDALFFIVASMRMVREIAACYGHRPSALATGHLLRRLVVEAGRLGAIDLAGAALTQHVGGAIAERVAANAAESLYATQRMARLGLVTMGLCRPIPFRPNELPGILSSLIGNLFARPDV